MVKKENRTKKIENIRQKNANCTIQIFRRLQNEDYNTCNIKNSYLFDNLLKQRLVNQLSLSD